MQKRKHKIKLRLTIIPCAFDSTATTIPCVSKKRVQGPYNITFSRLESSPRSVAPGSLTAAATDRFYYHNFQTVDEKFIEEEKKFRAVEKTVKMLLKNVSTYLEEFQVRN